MDLEEIPQAELKAQGFLQSALNSIQKEEFSTALKQLTQLLPEISTLSRNEQYIAYLWLATFSYIKGSMEDALNFCEKALILKPNDASIQIRKALIFLEMGDLQKSTDILSHPSLYNCANPSYFYHRAEVLALVNNLPDALDSFQRCISLCPRMFIAYTHKARCLIGLDRAEEALEFLRTSFHEYPESFEIGLNLAEVLAIFRSFDEAESLFDKLADKFSPDPQFYLSKSLFALKKTEDISAAIEFLKKSLQIDPKFQGSRIQLSELYLLGQNYDDAIFHFDEAIRYSRNGHELKTVLQLRATALSQSRAIQSIPELAEKMNR